MTAHHFCTGYPCPICYPPNYYTLPPAPTYTVSPGCICPPTSEKTCENPMCPRKGIKASSSGSPLSKGDRQ